MMPAHLFQPFCSVRIWYFSAEIFPANIELDDILFSVKQVDRCHYPNFEYLFHLLDVNVARALSHTQDLGVRLYFDLHAVGVVISRNQMTLESPDQDTQY